MAELDLQATLDPVLVAPEIIELRPDYRGLLIAVDGLVGGPTDEAAETSLREAEEAALKLLSGEAVDQVPHVAAWREAYRSFGAKPQRTRNSLEALLRRAPQGLPRIDRLTDTYNAISVLHLIPIGGEDLGGFEGTLRLLRAAGDEDFDTVADGEPIVEHPDPGEVVWRDDVGVTCRRWNWRQTGRTRLGEETRAALFILDALAPMETSALEAAGDDLVSRLGAEAHSTRRLIGGLGC